MATIKEVQTIIREQLSDLEGKRDKFLNPEMGELQRTMGLEFVKGPGAFLYRLHAELDKEASRFGPNADARIILQTFYLEQLKPKAEAVIHSDQTGTKDAAALQELLDRIEQKFGKEQTKARSKDIVSAMYTVQGKVTLHHVVNKEDSATHEIRSKATQPSAPSTPSSSTTASRSSADSLDSPNAEKSQSSMANIAIKFARAKPNTQNSSNEEAKKFLQKQREPNVKKDITSPQANPSTNVQSPAKSVEMEKENITDVSIKKNKM